jgi:uncharacterized protein (DUF433 family)
MDWEQHIRSDSTIMLGKPVVQGTRLTVEFVLDLFAGGWSEQEVIENYPRLSRDALRAVFAYAAESIRVHALSRVPKPAE